MSRDRTIIQRRKGKGFDACVSDDTLYDKLYFAQAVVTRWVSLSVSLARLISSHVVRWHVRLVLGRLKKNAKR